MENSLFPGKNVPGYREIYFPITRKYVYLTTDHFNVVYREKLSRLQENLFSCNREI
jgi:hypothetical protein